MSDLTDGGWRLVEPYLPPPSRCGRPGARSVREIVNGIFYVLRSGCPWRLIPSDLPPWPTPWRWFRRWRDEGLFARISHGLVAVDRERRGRETCPSAAVIDSQSVTMTESIRPRGHDAARRVLGRKRHAMVDTDGRLCGLHVHPASVQDRDGAVPLLKASRPRHPFIARAFADSAYNAERVTTATSIDVRIVRRITGQTGFVVHPRRWVVERTFAWLGRNCRLAKDFETTIASVTAFLYAASAMLLTRRLACSKRVPTQTLSGKKVRLRTHDTVRVSRLKAPFVVRDGYLMSLQNWMRDRIKEFGDRFVGPSLTGAEVALVRTVR